MPVPNLLNPVNVVIEPGAPAVTRFDEDAREPVRTLKKGPPISLFAQVEWAITSPRAFAAGPVQGATGYLVVRKVDIDAIPYSPRRGDKVTVIGNQTTDLYLSHVAPTGHYTDAGGTTLFRLYFEDRRPASGVART